MDALFIFVLLLLSDVKETAYEYSCHEHGRL